MFKVQKRKCATCIYSDQKPVNRTIKQLEAEIADLDCRDHFSGYRVCHHSDDVCCRGFWNRHKDHFDSGQIAQRLDIVVFVNEDNLAKYMR